MGWGGGKKDDKELSCVPTSEIRGGERGGEGGEGVTRRTIRTAKRDIPVFQTGYTGTREYEDHVQHKWRAVPQAACSSSVLSLRMKPH